MSGRTAAKRETDFVRGRGFTVTSGVNKPSKPTRRQFNASDDQLFSVRKRRKRNDDQTDERKNKKKRKKVKRDDDDDDQDMTASTTIGAADKVIIESMSLARLPVGIVVYGCVQSISDFELKLSLSGGIVVNVSITDISNSYTRLLQSFAQSGGQSTTDTDDQEVLKPNGIFRIGQCFPVKVLSKSERSGGFANIDIKGSINPRDIYADLKPSSVLKVSKMPVIAAVNSVEDHGYVMDIGFDDIKAFLPKDNAEAAIHALKGRTTLAVGQLVWCTVDNAANERSITLTTTAKVLSKFKLTPDSDVIASALTPGLTVTAIVMNVSDRGLEVRVLDDFKGFVTRSHLRNDWEFPKNMYKVGNRLDGTVLYRHPITKQFALSLKPRLEPKSVKNFLQSVKLGAIYDKAVVVGRDDSGAIVFKLPNGFKAIAPKKHLFDKMSDDLDLDNKFGVGSAHKCRVKAINLMDMLVVVTLRPSLLNAPVLSIDDLSIGSIVKGSVKKLTKKGVVVELGLGLKGFVPNIHLAETAQLQHPEQLFPMGKDVKCRVYRLDKSCTPCKVSLTCKKSLLAKKLNILSTYEKAVPGFQTYAVVALILKKGILVEFFNDIRGFIPLKYLSETRVEYPEKMFTVGQIIRCSVVTTDVDSERITCSLIDVKDIKTVKNKNNSSLTVGQVLRHMKIAKKSENGFDLIDEKKGLSVFLPFGHLADESDVSVLLSNALDVGGVVKEVVVYSIKSRLVIVTRKAALISAAKTKTFITSVDQLEPNVVIPVIISGFASYGIFVEMTPNIRGLVPKRHLIDGPIDEPRNLGFSLRQTVFAKFVEFEDNKVSDDNQNSKKKLVFSLKLSQVWDKENAPFADRVQWLYHNIADKHLALGLLDKNGSDNRLLKYRCGQIVNFRIVGSSDTEVNCNVRHTDEKKTDSVKGLVFKCQSNEANDTPVDYKVGTSGEAVVVDVNLEEQRVVIVINQRLVKQIKNSLKINTISCVRCEQTIKCTPIYICHRYVLVVLGGHAPGQLAYIPGKRHLNDIHGISHLFSLTECYHVIIKSVSNDDGVIAVLKPEKEHTIKTTKTTVKDVVESIMTKEDNKKIIAANSVKEPEVNAVKNVAEIVAKRVPNAKRRLDSESLEEPIKPKIMPLTSDSAKAKKFKRDVLKVDKPFEWTVEDATPDLNRLSSRLLTTNGGPDKEDALSSDSDTSGVGTDSEAENPKPRKTRSERNEEVKRREEALRKKEELLMDTERMPESVDDYERSVLASPNSSLVWLKYMAYHLEQSEVAKAREVAERALKTISFREERERLNVWFASLNLENLYGSQQTLDEVFGRAIQFNEPVLVYTHLADIYAKSGKQEESELVFHQMLKKFRQNKNVWISFGAFYMSSGRREASRKLMQRSLQCLPTREHMEVITKFGQMEFRSGDLEYGKTLFENVLANFPKRIDIWSVYIDMMLKYGVKDGDGNSAAENDDMVRDIFERLITFKLAAKQMKFVFKRYIDFETQRDNYDRIDRIKQKAMEYVEGRPLEP